MCMPWLTLCFTFDVTPLQIKVNGNDFYTFQHRLPLERVCAMQIDGDVCIQTINIIGVRLPTPEALVSMLWALGFALCSGANMFIQHHEFWFLNAFCFCARVLEVAWIGTLEEWEWVNSGTFALAFILFCSNVYQTQMYYFKLELKPAARVLLINRTQNVITTVLPLHSNPITKPWPIL